jgi:hypothetical protein
LNRQNVSVDIRIGAIQPEPSDALFSRVVRSCDKTQIAIKLPHQVGEVCDAAANEYAYGCQPDSTSMIAATKAGGTPYASA